MKQNEYFKKELGYIKDDNIRESAIYMLDILPSYFFEIPASSTGKYHPKFASSEHGLVKHTKVAVRIAYELLNDEALHHFSAEEKDLIIMGLILHDGLKSGLEHSKYTKFEHPLLIANYIKENKDNLKLNNKQLNTLCKIISSHMGPWNVDYNGNEVLPVPKSAIERFVHMCDYLSSKKFLDVEFDNNIDIKY